jgi:hypothetical protein
LRLKIILILFSLKAFYRKILNKHLAADSFALEDSGASVAEKDSGSVRISSSRHSGSPG